MKSEEEDVATCSERRGTWREEESGTICKNHTEKDGGKKILARDGLVRPKSGVHRKTALVGERMLQRYASHDADRTNELSNQRRRRPRFVFEGKMKLDQRGGCSWKRISIRSKSSAEIAYSSQYWRRGVCYSGDLLEPNTKSRLFDSFRS